MVKEKTVGFPTKKVVVVVIILAVAFFIVYYFDLLKTNCMDEGCFNDAVRGCNQAKFLVVRNFNYYRYDIEGSKGDSCEINVAIKKMAIGSSVEQIRRFEGKSMVCLIPESKLSDAKLENLEGLLNYCSGPLKEAIYELIIEKLYTLVVSNMGQVVGEMGELVKGEI
ncbi:hypothetical protein HY643_05030 [Candidatus Woesearchaeota archaeon]|nr:hypothetical protein [Candidatus Woesearchaeota archaeon]